MIHALQTTRSAPFTDFSTFQVTVLAMLARNGSQYGLALRDDLEASTDIEIYGEKLYPNLNQLAEQKLIEKRLRLITRQRRIKSSE